MIDFACISPHPPIILPSVGSDEDRQRVRNTIDSLHRLGRELQKIKPDLIVISSPHPDWGFEVPLHFLAKGLHSRVDSFQTKIDPPSDHFQAGRVYFDKELKNSSDKIALIASGDLSHVLKADGPYGLHPDGAKFDKALIDGLKNKDIKTILDLDNQYPEAGECGLRSFCFMLGILEAAKIDWQADILSYEGSFGVGYLVANFSLR
jgi:aromatic ring-opening dioxygenase LigB subunit